MKVTIYTISDEESSYCKDAKDFLTAHNIPFEEKDVEHDRQALAEMQRVAEDFAGVPVIVIDDNGQKKVVKGFTPQELEQALGLPSQPEVAVPASAPAEVAVAASAAPPAPMQMDQNMNQMDQSTLPAEPVASVVETPAPEMTTPAVAEAPVVEEHDDQLKGIMDTLSSSASSAAVEPVPAVPAEPAMPTPPAQNDWSAPATTPEPAVAPEPVTAEVPVAEPAESTPAAPAMPNPDMSTPAADSATDSSALPSIPDFPQK